MSQIDLSILERDFAAASSLPPLQRQDMQLRVVRRLAYDGAKPEFQSLLLRIARDTTQLDLVRIEALKAISGVRSALVFANRKEMIRLLGELSSSDVKLIRLWAVSEMQWFSDAPEILGHAQQLAADDNIDEDTRIAALDCIERGGPKHQSIEVLRAISTGDELPGFARDILRRWASL